MPEEIRMEDLIEVCEHLERLSELAELSRKFHFQGVEREELTRLLTLLEEVIKHSTERTDLPLLERIEWFKERIERWFPPKKRFSVTELREEIKKIDEKLFGRPIPSVIREARRGIRQLLDLPPPPTLKDLLDEFDALIEGFTRELQVHTKTLLILFNTIKPESIPWVIKFIEKSSHHVRSSLGEPLCIWWLSRVLGETKPVWRAVRGPLKVKGLEVDALSVSADQRLFAVAEVKVSKLKSAFEEAFKQVVYAAKFFMEPDHIRLAGFKQIKESCKLLEAAVVTLYNLGDDKERLKSEFSSLFEEEGLPGEVVSIYDIRDVLDTIGRWQFKAKERYRELFELFNKMLETT